MVRALDLGADTAGRGVTYRVHGENAKASGFQTQGLGVRFLLWQVFVGEGLGVRFLLWQVFVGEKFKNLQGRESNPGLLRDRQEY